jgi:hypothetical protein
MVNINTNETSPKYPGTLRTQTPDTSEYRGKYELGNTEYMTWGKTPATQIMMIMKLTRFPVITVL